jgi:heptosyltransferase III
LKKLKKIKIILVFFRICLTDSTFLSSFIGNLFIFAGIRLRSFFSGKPTIVLSLTEHIGDIAAAEPIGRYVREKNPGVFICRVIDKKYKLLEKLNPANDKVIAVSCFSEWIFLRHFLNKKYCIDLHINGKICGKHGLQYLNAVNKEISIENYLDKGNLLYCFSRSALIDIDDKIPPKLHLDLSKTDFKINSPYLLLHTSTNVSEKNWTSANWSQLTSFILKQYPSLHVVEIGIVKQIELNHKRYIDNTGEKDFTEIANLISESIIFIGLDSGFSHFANALNKEALILIGKFSNFIHYMPYSGKYLTEAEKEILYTDLRLSNLDIEIVKEKVDQKLSSLI